MSVVLPMFVAASFGAPADQPNPFQDNIDRGRAYLLKELKNADMGRLAIGTLALLKTAPNFTSGPNKGKVKKEPELQALVDKFVQLVQDKESEFDGHEGTYGIAVTVSCLIADDAGKHERIIRKLVAKIIANQLPNGGWHYPGNRSAVGDTSQTQYIVLALWDASLVGVEIPARVWDSVLYWQIRTQDASDTGGPGGFVYNPSKLPEDTTLVDQGSATATMGVAGLSTMLIAQSQLPSLKRRSGAKGPMLIDDLIRPAIDEEGDNTYVPKVTPEMVHPAIARAESWVARNTAFKAPYEKLDSAYYYLYGYERVAALRKSVNSPVTSGDWYGFGGRFLAKNQKPDGSWSGAWGGLPDTSFALLFLGKTMEKKLSKIDIEILNRSLAVGGTGGLPTADGSSGGSAFQRQYERYKTQPTSSIDNLVKILEDPDKIVEEETTAQVEQLTADQLKELVQKVGGDTRKLRQWAYDKRPDARKAALTALAKTRDARYAPILFDALNEKDAAIYTAAREGLRYMSRNVEVFGLPDAEKRTPANLKAGFERAREWFKSLNVEVAAYQEFTPPTP